MEGKSIVDNSPHGYRMELVVAPSTTELIAAARALRWLIWQETMFAHVLNVPSSEELWPGDIECMLPQFFAVRLVGDDEVYVHNGVIWDHIRDELMRQSSDPEAVTLESMWKSKHMVDCYMRDGSFANALFGDDLRGNLNLDQPPFSNLSCDDSDDNYVHSFESPEKLDDEDVLDTLNSEDLLTEEYCSPNSVQFRKSPIPQPNLTPQRRVGTIRPTEQKE